jgi:hypothetical protein
MKSKNYPYCCSEKPHAVHKVPLHVIKVWSLVCAVSAHKIIGPMGFQEITNSDHYILSIIKLFFRKLMNKEKTNSYFM